MKKLIALSLALALVAGAAFAEVTVGGVAGIGVTAISGNNADNSVLSVVPLSDNAPFGGGEFARWGQGTGGNIVASYANDEGTFGALVRVKPLNDWAIGTDRVFAWWQPLSVLKLTLGVDANGQFGINYIVGWGWHASDAEDYVAINGYGFTRGAWAYSGFGDFGSVLTLTPIDGLAITWAVPFKVDGKRGEAAETYNHSVVQLTYDIAGAGQIGITYTSGAGYRDWAASDPGAVYAQFYLNGIENLGLNVGLKYTFGGSTKYGNAGVSVDYQTPIAAGFGLAYTVSDTVGVKARLAAAFGGKKGDDDIPLRLGFDLMPYFDVGVCKVFINMGIDFTAETKDVDDSQVFAWYLNPYITKSAGGGTFYAGFQLYSDGAAKDAVIGWGIPIGIQVGF